MTTLLRLARIVATLYPAVAAAYGRVSAWREGLRRRRDATELLADARIIAAEVAELDRILNEKTGE